MNVFILGAGEKGSYLASILSKEEHRVILADKDLSRLEYLGKSMDVSTVYCTASNWRMFKELLGTTTEFFIAMTGSDETNLTACTLAKNLGYETTICRIKETGYLNQTALNFSKLFHVDYFLAAEILSAEELLETILTSGKRFSALFARGAIQLKTVSVPSSWQYSEIPLKKLSLPEELIIGLIWRKKGKESSFIFPHGEDTLLPGDEIIVVGESGAMNTLVSFFSLPKASIKKAMIVGGSDVAVHLALALEQLGARVTILEKNMHHSDYLAKILPKATIIHHDGKDLAFLLSENIAETDIFVTATHSDDTNLLIASMGKQIGAERVFSLISDLSVATIFQDAGILYAVSGKIHMANRVLSIIHGEKIVSISSICDDSARVVELKVSENSGLLGVPLKDLAAYLPKDLLVCVIEHKGEVMIGKGSRTLSAGDTVILLTAPRTVQELEHLF